MSAQWHRKHIGGTSAQAKESESWSGSQPEANGELGKVILREGTAGMKRAKEKASTKIGKEKNWDYRPILKQTGLQETADRSSKSARVASGHCYQTAKSETEHGG